MKAGIVTENKKVPIFEKALTAAGFKFTLAMFTSSTTTITVEYNRSQFTELEMLCRKVQAGYLIAESSEFKKQTTPPAGTGRVAGG